MNKFLEILHELGISKVKLAKYLHVSRQMIYNYLELENLNKWPKEKRLMIFKLLNISDGSEKTLNKIVINSNYITEVENRLNCGLRGEIDFSSFVDLKKLGKEEQHLFTEVTYLIKDKLTEDYKHNDNVNAIKYLYHILQAIDNSDELKYFLAYISKIIGSTDPNEFKFDVNKQFVFEGIMHSAKTLYSSGQANKARVVQSHARFVQEIEQKREEELSRTQELRVITNQALKELNYSDFNNGNAIEVYKKMTEIKKRNIMATTN